MKIHSLCQDFFFTSCKKKKLKTKSAKNEKPLDFANRWLQLSTEKFFTCEYVAYGCQQFTWNEQEWYICPYEIV